MTDLLDPKEPFALRVRRRLEELKEALARTPVRDWKDLMAEQDAEENEDFDPDRSIYDLPPKTKRRPLTKKSQVIAKPLDEWMT